MTHIEQIKDAIRQKQQEVWPTDTGEMKPATVPNNLEQGWLNALSWMEKFINSLPAEQPSEDLEKEIKRKYERNNALMMPIEDFRKLILHFTNWQKEQMLKSAIDGCHIKRNRYTQVKVLHGFSITCETIQKFKDGDKVKILIVKEDKQ